VKKVTVSLGEHSYDIIIGDRILSALGDAVSRLGLGPKEMVVTSTELWSLYGKEVQDSLAASGLNTCVAHINDDEESKSLRTVMSLYDKLVEKEFGRDSGITAVGGGVVGDIAGFTAATFMRGMRLVQVPTTLLAQVDSSIGGKTGVNLPSGKNLVGAFHQPALVWTDVSTLKTLPERELRSGLAEVIKYAVIADPELLHILEEKMQTLSAASSDTLIDIISRCCSTKARIVEQDEKEHGVRSILNYGHTFGHALETLTNYAQFTHGEAVALGMIVAARVSHQIGATDQATVEKQEHLIKTAGLPTRIDHLIDPQSVVRLLTRDKKRLAGQTRWVLPKTIGEVFLTDEVPLDVVLRVVKDLTSSREEKS
jgi:3-dehydroquinate synthase